MRRCYLSFMNEQKKLAFGEILRKLKKLVDFRHIFQFFNHKGTNNKNEQKTSVGPTKQRGCVGHERGSIVLSRFFFGSFLFINGKEMNDRLTEGH